MSSFLLGACSIAASKALTSPGHLRLDAVLMGDPQGAVDTYFSDNSVATEAVEFSPDGRYFASVSKSKNAQAMLMLWNAQTHDLIWQKPLSGETECVSFYKNAEYVVTGGEAENGAGELRIYDTQSASLIRRVSLPSYTKSIEGLRFAPNFKMLATGDEAGRLLVWDSSNSDPNYWQILKLIDVKNQPDALADLNQVDWTSDSRFLVTAERDGDVHLYDTRQISSSAYTVPIRKFTGFEGYSVKSVRISPNQRYVAAGAGGMQGVRVWDFETGILIAHLESESTPTSDTNKPLNAERIETVVFSHDSRLLLAGGTWPSWWFLANNQENKAFEVPISVFKLLPEAPNLKPENIESMERIKVQKESEVRAWRTEYLDRHPFQNRFVSGHDDGTIRLWEARF
uniref:WD40 repeat domain-containing protein n=1 Tax=Ningiella ruwaisensis TaxID=2364274 RepID=UPI0014463265|nr:hypothetical protein [Ningiella ruwaisensis]